MLGAGEVIEDVYDCYPNPRKVPQIEASVARINARIGVQVPGEEMVRILRALFMQATLCGDKLTVVPPDFREDIETRPICPKKCCASTVMSTSARRCCAARPHRARAMCTCSFSRPG